MEFLWQNHPAYRDIVVNSAALEILPQNGSIATEIAILETDTVSSELLPAEDQEQYIDDPIHVGFPALQQNDLEIDQLRQEIRNQRNQRRRRQGFTEIQAPTCQSTPLDEFDQNLPLFSSAFPYLFPYGQAEFRTPRQRAIKLVDYLIHAVRYKDGRLVLFYFILFYFILLYVYYILYIFFSIILFPPLFHSFFFFFPPFPPIFFITSFFLLPQFFPF